MKLNLTINKFNKERNILLKYLEVGILENTV